MTSDEATNETNSASTYLAQSSIIFILSQQTLHGIHRDTVNAIRKW